MLLRIFGAALDALDDPERVGLKQAWLRALAEGRIPAGLPRDPYDALAPLLIEEVPDRVRPAGKLPLPGWLTPRPLLEDRALVRAERYRAFLEGDRIRDWADACARFVEESVFPDLPLMIAVDHALTAGPLRALSALHGPGAVAAVVVDSHLDAVPCELRAGRTGPVRLSGGQNCGSFLAALLDDGTLLPENLLVVGVSDSPVPGATAPAYEQAYLGFVSRGVRVFPRDRAGAPDFPALLEAELDRSPARLLYVSLDADAGALSCMNAVRFLDTRGLDEAPLLGLASALRNLIDRGRFRLAGADVAEVDVHLLDLAGTPHGPDRTARVCVEFVKRLIQEPPGTSRSGGLEQPEDP